MKHNDYVVVIREYLIRYHEFKQHIQAVKAQIDDLRAKLPLNAAPKVPSLSPAPGGSGKNTSQQERCYFGKEAMRKRIREMTADLWEIEPVMQQLDISIAALTPADRRIIVGRLINNDSWILIASDLHTSPTTCRRELGKALEHLAGIYWGPQVIPRKTHLMFLGDNSTLSK
jgi:hypothetical protein